MAKSQSHPFLDPLWRRVVLVAICAIWTAIEAWFGNTIWFVMVGVITVYGAWTYLYDYEPSGVSKDSPPGT